MKDSFKIADLISQYIKGEIQEKDLYDLDEWLESSEENRQLFVSLMDGRLFEEKKKKYDAINSKAAYEKIRRRNSMGRLKRYSIYISSSVAVILLSVGLFFFFHSYSNEDINHSLANHDTITTGEQKAVIHLASGERWELNNMINDTINPIQDEHSLIVKDGLLKISGKSETRKKDFYTIEIPRGAEYRTILPDGTEVWLNAFSKLKIPTDFAVSERSVELEGEAYFKVSHNAQLPFTIACGMNKVRVLGTEFNVSNYTGKPSRTTLVNGSIEISDHRGWQKILKPGDQAISYEGKHQIVKVDPYYYTAWKDGYFVFKDSSLEEIMEKLSLWYNFDYIFKDKNCSGIKLTARMKKYDGIDKLLNILTKTQKIIFKKEGKTILIYEK